MNNLSSTVYGNSNAGQIWLLVILAGLACGCGFHLRGSIASTTAIDQLNVITPTGASNLATAFDTELKQQMLTQHISRTADAPWQIELLAVEKSRRTLALDLNALASEYQITLTVDFVLRNTTDGLLLLENQPVQVSRNYQFDENEVLAKNEEALTIENELQRELAQMLLQRTNYTIGNYLKVARDDANAARPE